MSHTFKVCDIFFCLSFRSRIFGRGIWGVISELPIPGFFVIHLWRIPQNDKMANQRKLIFRRLEAFGRFSSVLIHTINLNGHIGHPLSSPSRGTIGGVFGVGYLKGVRHLFFILRIPGVSKTPGISTGFSSLAIFEKPAILL